MPLVVLAKYEMPRPCTERREPPADPTRIISCALSGFSAIVDRSVEVTGGVENALRIEGRAHHNADSFDVGGRLERELSAVANIELKVGSAHDVGQQGNACCLLPARRRVRR